MKYIKAIPIDVKITKVTYDCNLNASFDPPSRMRYPTAKQALRKIREEKEIEIMYEEDFVGYLI